MLPKSVSGYLESHRQEHLGKLFELLSIPSIANNADDGCDRAANWLVRYLESLGLEAAMAQTGGKPNVIASSRTRKAAPTVLVYGHYDVQPPDPLELWETPPFEPTVRDGWIYARGADDNKGQLFAHLMAIGAWQRAGELPVNVKVFLEGEEEIGSPNLEPFVKAHKKELAADVAVVSDSSFFAEGVPSIIYGLRGLVYLELTLDGPGRDVHSGLYGGLVANPANALAKMIANMHDAEGRVTIPGFYDDVIRPTDEELLAWGRLPFDEANVAADLGLDRMAGGEAHLSALERCWARPTLDCSGIIGGYTAPGTKTIIPARASAKLSMRLVADQDPEKIVKSFQRFVADHTPAGTKATVCPMARGRPVLLKTDSPAIGAARRAYVEAFGRDAVLIRCGASVPVTELIQRILHLEAVMMGFGLPDGRPHSPNERLSLQQVYRGAMAAAALLNNLAADAAG